MKKLLKEYDFTSDVEYYQLIADSFFNGQKAQAWKQFSAMPKKNRIEMLKMITFKECDFYVADQNVRRLFDFI